MINILHTKSKKVKMALEIKRTIEFNINNTTHLAEAKSIKTIQYAEAIQIDEVKSIKTTHLAEAKSNNTNQHAEAKQIDESKTNKINLIAEATIETFKNNNIRSLRPYILSQLTIIMTTINSLLTQQKIKTVQNINNKLNQMPYYRNHECISGFVHNIASHEDAVKDILISENLTQFYTKHSKKVIYEWINDYTLSNNIMPVNTFISQPCGPQESPDFIVKFVDGTVLAIECKSSSSTIPLYNSGGIKHNYFYIFSSQKTNETVTYMGSDIINEIQQKLIDDHIKEARERDEILNKKLKEYDTNSRGVCYYTRPMIGQSGGNKYTNYFTHTNKENNRNSIMDFIMK